MFLSVSKFGCYRAPQAVVAVTSFMSAMVRRGGGAHFQNQGRCKRDEKKWLVFLPYTHGLRVIDRSLTSTCTRACTAQVAADRLFHFYSAIWALHFTKRPEAVRGRRGNSIIPMCTRVC